MTTMFGLYPFLQKLFADGGYQGPKFRDAPAKALPGLSVTIVKRSDTANGFEVLPRRWVVERTIGWLNRRRRLAKDFENLTAMAVAFISLASIRLMLRKLSNPLRDFPDGLLRRSFVPHREIPAGVPGQRRRRSRRGAGMGHALRPLVQRRASSRRHPPRDPGATSCRPGSRLARRSP